MLETKLWHNKTETKNVKVTRMAEFIKTCDQYPRRLNFGDFFNSIILPPTFIWGKTDLQKTLFWVISSCLGIMIKTRGRVFLGGMSKNELIQFFDSQMYLPVILTLYKHWRDKPLRSP